MKPSCWGCPRRFLHSSVPICWRLQLSGTHPRALHVSCSGIHHPDCHQYPPVLKPLGNNQSLYYSNQTALLPTYKFYQMSQTRDVRQAPAGCPWAAVQHLSPFAHEVLYTCGAPDGRLLVALAVHNAPICSPAHAPVYMLTTPSSETSAALLLRANTRPHPPARKGY